MLDRLRPLFVMSAVGVMVATLWTAAWARQLESQTSEFRPDHRRVTPTLQVIGQ